MNGAVPGTTARFLFDPLHDPDGTPSLGHVERWAQSMLRTEGSKVHSSAVSTSRALPKRSLWDALRSLQPGSRRSDLERSVSACLPHLLKEAARVHDATREFGVDPSSHPLVAELAERLFAFSCFIPQVEHARELVAQTPHYPLSATLGRTMDEIDLTARMDRMRAKIREALEVEALTNIVESSDVPEDRPRIIAGMRAALDEITDPDIRARLVAALSRVDGNGSVS
jgi:hypothetical protein